MRAGQRNQKVIIEQKTESIDSVGGVTETWTTYATEWAEVLTQSGKEFLKAREQHSSLTHVLTIRFNSGVTPKMRVNDSGSYYNIIAAFDPSKRRRETKLYCNEQL